MRPKVQQLLQTEDSDEDLTLQPQATTSAYETHDGGILAFDFKCPDRGKGKGNFEVPFSRFPELFRARSRLYRSQILQVNIRWKALVEIYTKHSFAPFSNLKIFVKNR